MNELFSKVEAKWLIELYQYNKKLFSDKHIPSHNHSHHIRVWQNAKNLTTALHNSKGNNFTIEKIECLIIAVFFHDTGLTVTLDEKHGKAGKELCAGFLQQTKTAIPDGINEALTAIEFHENKEYKCNFNDNTSILSILSTADDMDAFGAIGAYRYAEIYLMRNIEPKLLAERVLLNLEKRYHRMDKSYGFIKSFVNEVYCKYLITFNFYNNLYKENKQYLTGSGKIIDIIKNEIILNKLNPEEVWQKYLVLAQNDDFVVKFIINILEEYKEQPCYVV